MSYKYDIYGKTFASNDDVNNPYQYNAEYTDSTTGLQYLRARYYNSNTHRFQTKDTYQGTTSQPITRNNYAYANNNPVNFVDPSGHFSLSNAWNWATDKATDFYNWLFDVPGNQTLDIEEPETTSMFLTGSGPVPSSSTKNLVVSQQKNSTKLSEKINQAFEDSKRVFCDNAKIVVDNVSVLVDLPKATYEALDWGDDAIKEVVNDNQETLDEFHELLKMLEKVPGIGIMYFGSDIILYVIEGDYMDAAAKTASLGIKIISTSEGINLKQVMEWLKALK